MSLGIPVQRVHATLGIRGAPGPSGPGMISAGRRRRGWGRVLFSFGEIGRAAAMRRRCREHQVRAFLADHDAGGIGVARDHGRHDRGVGDPQAKEAVHAQLRVDDRHGIGLWADHAGARGWKMVAPRISPRAAHDVGSRAGPERPQRRRRASAARRRRGCARAGWPSAAKAASFERSFTSRCQRERSGAWLHFRTTRTPTS